MSFAELHCHSHFSFLDGASAPDELVERAVELGLSGLALTDHQGLYGAVRFSAAANAAGLRPVVGVEIELLDPAVPDPAGAVVPARRARRARARTSERRPADGVPVRPRPERARLPGHREAVKEDYRGVGEAQRGPHLVLLAGNETAWRSLCRLISRANLAGTKAVPRFDQALLRDHADGVIGLSGCRDGEIARRLRAGDRRGARAVAEAYAGVFGGRFFLELEHHLLPDDDWLVAETVALADELGLPMIVTNDVHYARPEGRELADVVTAIRHGRTLDTLGNLRRPDGESYLKGEAELAALPPADGSLGSRVAAAWAEGIRTTAELAAGSSVELSFERYRFPGFEVPEGETPFSHLGQLCWDGARRRYHPLTPAVVKQLAHELDVIETTGLAEFFLICWDLMRFAKSEGIPAQGRGSAADSIVAYVLGITRVDPIRHELLFERFINEGRTAYPDVDIDFSSERREEVIQYVYRTYGAEHTGMVCNLVTYRARSAVREVGYALGFPRPLVDRVAKALETYDSVMVRRDLEAEGGFGQFFVRPGEEVGAIAVVAEERGLTDGMGQLRHARGGHLRTEGLAAPAGTEAGAQARAVSAGLSSAGQGPHQAGEPADDRQAVARGRARVAQAEEADESPDRPSGLARALDNSGATIGALRAPTRVLERSARMARRGLTRAEASLSTPVPPGVADPGLDAGEGAIENPNPARDELAHRASPAADRSSATGSGIAPGNGGLAHRLDDRLAPRTVIRPGARSDDEGGPGDTPVSVRWLRGESPGMVDGRRIDPESGVLLPAERRSSVARVEPQPPPERRPGTTAGMSDWERWLEMCARLDGFPRHLSIHTGGMLITAAPLIDIAPLERATMPNRVVVQYDKRDVEEMKLIKLDLLGLGMLAAIDETLQLITHDCAVCIDLDRIPEEIPEVFEMLQAADTVGVFQVESRAQMQTLPKSRPVSLDDLVVEVAIIRPGPIQGNAVHPYLRRKQGLEPVTYLHPSLQPILRDSLGVILYQEQVMRIAIDVAGFTPAGSDAFRRAMGTWRSTREMEKLHEQFVEGCIRVQDMPRDDAEELFRQCAAFASFGFAKSHAAAFARTAYESSFLKLFYPAQFVVGLINAQPMGFYPVEVLVNDAKRHGVEILPVDVNASAYRTTTEWVGPGAGPEPVRSPACFVPSDEARARWAAESATGWGVRLGLHLVKGIGEEHAESLDEERERGPYTSLADVVERTGLSEEVIERLIRSGALDGFGEPRRTLLWQLRETARPVKGKAAGRIGGRVAGRPMDLRLPATPAPELPAITEVERLGDSYAVLSLDARRQVVGLFRTALERLGAITNGDLAARRPGVIRIAGLVVTRQHPMTARGTVFLALEDETGMVNVTLWPDSWARHRSVIRRHALLLVDGTLQREGNVVNVIAREVRSLVDVARSVGGPGRPDGVKQLGWAGTRRSG